VGLDGAHGVGGGAAVLPGIRPLHPFDGEGAGADQHPGPDPAPHFAPGDVGTGFAQAQALQLHRRPRQHRLHRRPDVDQGPGESLGGGIAGFWGALPAWARHRGSGCQSEGGEMGRNGVLVGTGRC